jgi:hypothetical protein
MKIRTTLYLSKGFHKDLKDVCYREGVSMSEKVEALCQPYVETHKTGNPQTMLEHATLPKGVPLYRSCIKSNKELHRGEFYCQRYSTWRRPNRCDKCGDYHEN